MSLEGVKRIVEMEKLSQKRKEEAEQTAKRLIAEAEKEGSGHLEVARWEAEMKVKKLMTAIEQKSAENAAKFRAETDRQCEQIKEEARKYLDDAAELIVRRVVAF